MRFWFSPLPLPTAVIAELDRAGLESWPHDQGGPKGGDCLLVYDSPEQLIGAAAEAGAKLSSAALVQGYRELLHCAEASGQLLVAGWRLQRLGGSALRHWLVNHGPIRDLGAAEPIPPLVASVILSLIETQVQLLDAYSDLELRAELLGSQPVLNYRQRLQQAIVQADPLPQLLAALQNREGELQEALYDAELTLLQLRQVQEELEHSFLDSQAGRRLVNAQSDQLNRARRLLAKLRSGDLSPLGGDGAAVAVEVLPSSGLNPRPTTLQAQLLLDTYASSLERAASLLAKAMRN